MTCAFDWIFNGTAFYDAWVSRSLVGDTFFEIPHDGAWTYAKDLFWSDPDARQRLEAYKPFQIYSCRGGMAALIAASFADDTVEFRASDPGECYMGEPTLLAKNLYRQGLGKFWLCLRLMSHTLMRGYAGDHVDQSRLSLAQDEIVQWQSAPPPMVKCLPSFQQPSWTMPLL
jgi:alpha-1,3-mannosyltransferase